MKKHRSNRLREREGINAAQAFFESNGCIFQEVGLQNDFGKDAYVDLGDEEVASSICAAVQVKSGISYRNGKNYKIPLSDDDFEYWSTSTVPVVGIVYEPVDKLLRWVNITNYLDELDDARPSYITVDREAILTTASLRVEFVDSIKGTVTGFRKHPLAQLCERDSEKQLHAVLDCFILGRSDPRLFIGLRYLLFQLSKEARRRAISALAHLTPHPDIFWNSRNWIPYSTRGLVNPHFRWSVTEIEQFLLSASSEEWQRGGVGQSIYMLILEDPDIDGKLADAAEKLACSNSDAAFIAVLLLVSMAGEKGQMCLDVLVARIPMIKDKDWTQVMYEAIHDHGFVSFW
jgi:hypothetical protein